MTKTKSFTNFLFSIVLLFSAFYSSNAQAPIYQWAKNSTGGTYGGARCITTDNNGNIYSAGVFTTPTITFDNQSINNISTNSNLRESYIVKHNPSGDVLWLKHVGGTGEEQIFDITSDNNNNIYIIGDFDSPTLTFGNSTLVNAGNQDVFLAKFDSDGNPLWAKSFGSDKYDYGTTLTVDNSGNVFIGGQFFSSTINFDSYVLTNVEASLPNIDHDVFYAKLDASGNVLWAKSNGGTGYDELVCMTTDSNGNLIISGYFYSPSIVFGTSTLYNTNNYGDIFLVKYNSDGVFGWARKYGGSNYDNVRDIDTDSDGNIYTVGHFESPTLTFGSTTLTNQGSTNIFLTKHNTSGTVLWAKQAGTTQSNLATGLTVDTNNDIYITGAFSASISFESLPSHTTLGSNDIFICKYNVAGNALWSKTTGGSGFDTLPKISSSPTNEISITGYSGSTSINFDNIPLTTLNNMLFVAKFPGSFLEIEEHTAENFSIFPNPVKSVLTIKNNNASIGAQFTIYDINGRLVVKGNLNQTNTIDTSSLENGLYTISIENSFTTKFIKK